MKIGIDIDDTTVITVNAMLKYADLFEKEISGVLPQSREDFGLIKSRYYLEALYGWDKPTKMNFFERYYENVLKECTILPDANKIINKLKEEGNTIHFITARLMSIPNCDTESITKECLNKYGVKYDSLNLHISDKLKFCKKNEIDLLIEDSYETCLELKENNIGSILMTTKMNSSIETMEIKRANSWNEVYEIIKRGNI